MSDGDDSWSGFLALDPSSARELEAAAVEIEHARASLDEAVGALAELAEDMKIEAVRRLAERGASAAQIERYEDGYRAKADSVAESRAALREAAARMSRALARLR